MRKGDSMKEKLFSRDFTMVVIGQIISLFGNNVLRYALPLYLLNKTHSASLFGLVSACSFIPMVVLAPVGGLVADRVNKRNVMVCLDFATAAIVVLYSTFYMHWNLVALLITVLMLLYGIQGAYQPAVQASIPVLVSQENLIPGNAVINMVNSLASMLGPVLGGLVFGLWGLQPVLIISIMCFLFSAVMEIFIRIPFEKRDHEAGVFKTARADIQESFLFIKRDCPAIGRVGILLAMINLVLSALIIVGLPVIINEHLGFPQALGNRLCGYTQGALAAGGLLGGIISGTIGKRYDIRRSACLLFFCTLTLLPTGLVLLLPVGRFTAYAVITVDCFIMMAVSTLLSILLITYVQGITPNKMIGKVISLITCLVMCANPAGQALYGFLFEQLAASIYWIFFMAFAVCLLLTVLSRKIFAEALVQEPIAI